MEVVSMDSKGEMRYAIEPPVDTRLNGAIRAFGGIKDAMTIVHGRSCCHSDNFLYRLMTGGHSNIRLTGGGLRLRDISTGGHHKLGLSLAAAYEQFKPSLISILVTSVPLMMGDDVEGVIMQMNEKIPIPILALSCPNHVKNASLGYDMALLSLCDYMVGDGDGGGDGHRSGINLIGIKSDDPYASSDLIEIKRMLNDQGITVNAVFSCDTFESLKNAPSAELNVVIGGEGIGLAQKMEELFNIPYTIVSHPFGVRGSVEFLEAIAGSLGREIDERIIEAEEDHVRERITRVYGLLEGIFNLKTAVVGESGRAFDLARFLNDELCLDVKLLAATSINAETSKRQDEDYFGEFLKVDDRLYLDEVLGSMDIELMMGSSGEGAFCRENRIPLTKVFYPTVDRVTISDYPITGFRGVINLTELVLNNLMDMNI
jgi:nitrogenase molybdenum-iron protein beta chain